jgi:hypothetical protein
MYWRPMAHWRACRSGRVTSGSTDVGGRRVGEVVVCSSVSISTRYSSDEKWESL